jgi:hypothetical protein
MLQYLVISLRLMGKQAVGTVLDPIGGVGELAAALVVQHIEGTVAEHAVEMFGIGTGMTGEIFAVWVAEETVTMLHSMLLFWNDRQTAACPGRQFVCDGLRRKERVVFR